MCPPLSFDHRNIEIKQHRQTVTVQLPIHWGTTRLRSIRPTELELSTYVDPKKDFKSTNTKETFKLKGDLNCKTTGVVYLLSCEKCNIQYVGQIDRTIFCL